AHVHGKAGPFARCATKTQIMKKTTELDDFKSLRDLRPRSYTAEKSFHRPHPRPLEPRETPRQTVPGR
ncbi:hypothetical protein LLE87_31700, partial [Paenibacillus polymyxa]|nr:hypothetical protein [Paenibacillus polymyxa]